MKSKRGIPVFMMVAGSLVLGIGWIGDCRRCGPELENIQLTGFGSYQFGQIEKGEAGSELFDHYWNHQVYAGIGFIASLSDRMNLCGGIEGKMWNAFPGLSSTQGQDRTWTEQHFSVWVTEASGTYSFGDTTDKLSAKVTAGYFPYKYNPESRNLGEYMFRSFTYPGLIFNTFDFAAADVLGAKATIKLNLDKIQISNDFMLLEQDATWPFGDFSLAYVGDCNFAKIIDFGAGVDFANYISVNSFNTTPACSDDAFVDSLGYIKQTVKSINGKDTTWDTAGYYTFKAIKPMARLTLDPKPLMGDVGRMLGSEDLKLYGEGAIIGTENYPYYYDDIQKRMPVMFGFYLPTFKVLDMLNIEFEHYAFPFYTSNWNQSIAIPVTLNNGPNAAVCLPIPGQRGFIWSPDNLASTSWKWSVYLKKTITSHVAFTLQCSHDHYRLNFNDGYPNYSESLILPGEWMWTAKFSGNF